jgi:uncharacterized protein (DUF2147 family)
MRMIIRPFRLALLTLALAAASAFAQAPTPEGRWKTIDDKTGRVKAVVRIVKDGDALRGTIEKLFRLPEEVQDPVCKACKGDRKDKRITGMTILWDLRAVDGSWDNGSILDPQNGKIYRCKASLSPDGQSLTVRGYLGFSLLGRSQTWKRLPPDEEAQPTAQGK